MERPAGIPKHRKRVLAYAASALIFALPLAACEGETTADVNDPAMPDRPEDHVIEGVQPSGTVRTDTDPTPQSGTGGGIPEYDPSDAGRAVEPADGSQPQEQVLPDDAAPEPANPLPVE